MPPREPVFRCGSGVMPMVVIRIIPTAEGLCFCAVSAGGGAFVARPGEVLELFLTPGLENIQSPYTPGGMYNPVPAIQPSIQIEIFKEKDNAQ